ncbi:MAG TPA: SH3 domain-containing protein [Arsenicitalea sp.]|jgi:uncharacterized protein YraI|nr:SH3 domain-containing protein [Arsenicitalea sp.]
MKFGKSIAIAAVATFAVLGAAGASSAATTATARASGQLPVYAGPGSGYAVVGRLAKDERVSIERCTYSGRWCLVSDGRPIGWVLSSYLVGASAKLQATPPKFLVNPFRESQHPRRSPF